METILFIITAGLFGTALFLFDPYVEFVSEKMNFKPFNCVLCTTFWLSTGVFLLVGFPVQYSIISAFVAEASYRYIASNG